MNSNTGINSKKKRVLIIAPHPDDEINVGGPMIPFYIEQGYEVYVLYATNGDYTINGEIRLREAICACRILGCDEEHIIFLGYPDSGNDNDNISFHSGTDVYDNRGRNKTYALCNHMDWSFSRRGEHSTYVFENYIEDMKDVLMQLRPDIIFASYLDSHNDHVICRVVFEKALESLHSLIGFKPCVYWRFAYANAFLSTQDYYNKQLLLPTQKPPMEGESGYTLHCIDTPGFEWGNRVAFPVTDSCALRLLGINKIARASRAHKSQNMYKHVMGIINSDWVFWRDKYYKGTNDEEYLVINRYPQKEVCSIPAFFFALDRFLFVDAITVEKRVRYYLNRLISIVDQFLYNWIGKRRKNVYKNKGIKFH